LALAFRSTREKIIEDDLEKERAKKLKKKRAAGDITAKRANLNAEERATIMDRMPPCGLMDYLWRLRVRANYSDASVFTSGPELPNDAKVFQRHLRLIVSTTMLVHEIHIARLVGVRDLAALMDGWLQRHMVSGLPAGLAQRRALVTPLDSFRGLTWIVE
jgi:hypothetical protein